MVASGLFQHTLPAWSCGGFGGGSEGSPQLWTGLHKKEGAQHYRVHASWPRVSLSFLLRWSILALEHMVGKKLTMLTLLCKPSNAPASHHAGEANSERVSMNAASSLLCSSYSV